MPKTNAASSPEPEIITDPVESAKSAGLRYVNDDKPGITRKRRGRYFSYFNPDGERITDEEAIQRIKSLGIPPAWNKVWICPNPKGHIQAIGRDLKGRKQYRYHPRWREVRDETKYGRMIAFGQALPAIRKQVNEDLRKHGFQRERVLAIVVKLLETTLIRVGNEEYARTNKSFGLTTMRNRHVEVEGGKIRFKFRGKSGKDHLIEVSDRRLARAVERISELPGQEIFQYLDDEDEPHTVTSEDVNDYLREITEQDFTAKDFRTWTGTVLAARALQKFKEFDSEAQAKKNVVEAIEEVAQSLGNTPTICRKCYVHPIVLDSYLDGTLLETLKQRTEKKLSQSLGSLEPEEAAVLAFLQQRLAQEAEEQRAHKSRQKETPLAPVPPPEKELINEERREVLEQLEEWLETPMLALGIAWLALFVVEVIWGLSPLLELFGTLIWAVFIFDFALRFTLAPHKLDYLKSNWLTAISLVIPALRIFRITRVVRVLRAARAARGFRLVRVVGSLNRGMRALGKSMGRRGFGYLVALTLVVTLVGAAGMLAFESEVQAENGLRDYGTALWWTAMLMTTMGSDYWPQTPEGRVLALMLSVYAFAVFGYVTATLATFFIGRDAEDKDAELAGATSIDALRSEIAELRAEIRTLSGSSRQGKGNQKHESSRI